MAYLEQERFGKVAVLTMNRPERRNALGTETLAGLTGAFASVAADPEVNVVVLAGAGKGFCAGADLKEFCDDDLEAVSRINLRIAAFTRSLALMGKPVVAAVHGFAMGGGLVLAASCDVVVTAADTRWQLPEVSLGWLPGFGLQTLCARMGAPAAKRMVFGVDPLNGEAARAKGLADIVAAEGETVTDCALKHAGKLAALPPHSVATAKSYFAPMVSPSGEPMDMLADKLYCADARHPSTQATTMQRYRQS